MANYTKSKLNLKTFIQQMVVNLYYYSSVGNNYFSYDVNINEDIELYITDANTLKQRIFLYIPSDKLNQVSGPVNPETDEDITIETNIVIEIKKNQFGEYNLYKVNGLNRSSLLTQNQYWSDNGKLQYSQLLSIAPGFNNLKKENIGIDPQYTTWNADIFLYSENSPGSIDNLVIAASNILESGSTIYQNVIANNCNAPLPTENGNSSSVYLNFDLDKNNKIGFIEYNFDDYFNKIGLNKNNYKPSKSEIFVVSNNSNLILNNTTNKEIKFNSPYYSYGISDTVENNVITIKDNIEYVNLDWTKQIKNILDINNIQDCSVFIDKITMCTCPKGFTGTTNCQKLEYTSATAGLSAYTITKAATNSAYGDFGLRIYDISTNPPVPYYRDPLTAGTSPHIVYNGTTGATELPILLTGFQSTFWGTTSGTTDGRLNQIGVWGTGGSAPTCEWIGFTSCFTLTADTQYYIGIGADNLCRFSIDGTLIFDLTVYAGSCGFPYSGGSATANGNFQYWHIIPINLGSGFHIVEMEGFNYGSAAALGAEIYQNTIQELTAATATTMLNIVFTTIDITGQTFSLGEDSGYSCPSGYALYGCSGTPYCVKITNSACTETDVSVKKYIDPDNYGKKYTILFTTEENQKLFENSLNNFKIGNIETDFINNQIINRSYNNIFNWLQRGQYDDTIVIDSSSPLNKIILYPDRQLRVGDEFININNKITKVISPINDSNLEFVGSFYGSKPNVNITHTATTDDNRFGQLIFASSAYTGNTNIPILSSYSSDTYTYAPITDDLILSGNPRLISFNNPALTSFVNPFIYYLNEPLDMSNMTYVIPKNDNFRFDFKSLIDISFIDNGWQNYLTNYKPIGSTNPPYTDWDFKQLINASIINLGGISGTTTESSAASAIGYTGSTPTYGYNSGTGINDFYFSVSIVVDRISGGTDILDTYIIGSNLYTYSSATDVLTLDYSDVDANNFELNPDVNPAILPGLTGQSTYNNFGFRKLFNATLDTDCVYFESGDTVSLQYDAHWSSTTKSLSGSSAYTTSFYIRLGDDYTDNQNIQKAWYRCRHNSCKLEDDTKNLIWQKSGNSDLYKFNFDGALTSASDLGKLFLINTGLTNTYSVPLINQNTIKNQTFLNTSSLENQFTIVKAPSATWAENLITFDNNKVKFTLPECDNCGMNQLGNFEDSFIISTTFITKCYPYRSFDLYLVLTEGIDQVETMEFNENLNYFNNNNIVVNSQISGGTLYFSENSAYIFGCPVDIKLPTIIR